MYLKDDTHNSSIPSQRHYSKVIILIFLILCITFHHVKIKRYCQRYSFRQKGGHNAGMSLIHKDLLLDGSLRKPTYHLWQRTCWWWPGDPGDHCGWRWSPWCPALLSGRIAGPDWCIISWHSLSIKTATFIDNKINHRCMKNTTSTPWIVSSIYIYISVFKLQEIC